MASFPPIAHQLMYQLLEIKVFNSQPPERFQRGRLFAEGLDDGMEFRARLIQEVIEKVFKRCFGTQQNYEGFNKEKYIMGLK